MARFERFEDIEAWKKARALSRLIYSVSSQGGFDRDKGLKDQMRRAAVSVSSHIAEGFERGGNKEFLQFLSVARASAGELRSQIYIALDAGYINEAQFKDLHCLALETSNLIGELVRYLRQSQITGRKYSPQP